jgi:membrane protein
LREQFTNILEDLTRKVSSKHYGDIGAAGLVLLVWAGIGLLVTIERSFNRIYDCPTGRPWVSRVVIYWAVLTLGPVLLFVSLYLTGVVTHELRLTHMPMLGQLTWVPALLASWLLLFLLYLLMPNTKVHTRSALVGSLVTAALYETTKVGFQLYVHEAVPYAKLYGSLGLIPLFLFWLYLTWIIVLGGLELTYALQAMRGRTFKYLRAHGEGILAGDPLWVVPLMVALGRAFTAGKTPTVMELSGATGIPMSAVMELVRRLERAGLVHRVLRAGARDVTLALSVPADKIELTRLLDVGAAAGTGSAARELARRPGNALLAKLADAQRRAVGDATLASLLAEK